MAKSQEMFRRASSGRRRPRGRTPLTAASAALLALLAGCVTQPAATPQTQVIRPQRQQATAPARRGNGGGGPPGSIRTTANTEVAAARPTAGRGRPAGPPAVAPAAETDDCAARMHDISGMLLLYYATHRRLPERLDELAPLADPGADTSFTCPTSGKPYVYVPGGLSVPSNQQRFLILYDPTPAHDGHYWGITAAPPEAGQALNTWITPLSVPVLQAYQASALDNPPPPVPAQAGQPQTK